MSDLFGLRGVVPLFAYQSFNPDNAMSETDDMITVSYHKKMIPFVVGALDIYRQQDIYSPDSDIETFQNLLEVTQGNLIREADSMPLSEADKQVICDAIQCATIEIMQASVAGLNTGITPTIDPDTGEIVIDDGESGGSGGTVGTADELQYGLVKGFVEKFQGFFEDMDTMYDSHGFGNESVGAYYMEQLYETADQTAMLNAVSQYFSYRETPKTPFVITESDIEPYLYCDGINRQSVNRYAILEASVSALDDCVINIMNAITDNEFNKWAISGDGIPRLGYETMPCYLQPVETKIIKYTDIPYNVWYLVWSNYPPSHRWRVEWTCIEEFIDSSGNTWDGIWYTDTGGVSSENTIKIAQHSTAVYSYLEGFDGKLPIGSTYVNEIYNSGGWHPTSVRQRINTVWTQGQLEVKLYDLGYED